MPAIDDHDFLFMTGATGPTGLRLVVRLLDEGRRLKCLVHRREAARFLPESDRLEQVQGDLREKGDWMQALVRAEAVLHLAHVGFAPAVIEACRLRGVERFICLSSTRRFTRFPEETARRVIEGEAAVERSELSFTILRPTMIYGSHRDHNLARIAEWLRRRPWMPLVRGGRNLVQPIHSADVVEAIVAALGRPNETRRRALNLAGPEAMTWRAMVEAVGASIGVRVRWIPLPYPVALAVAALAELKKGGAVNRATIRRLLEDKAFDIAEAQEALGGWTPRPLAEGLANSYVGPAAAQAMGSMVK
jgi:nucleoside-diphosphate-sugar epimerase